MSFPLMPMLPVKTGGPPLITWVTTALNTSALTTYTFSGVSIGTGVNRNGIIVNAINTNVSTRTLSSATFTGATSGTPVSAVILQNPANFNSNNSLITFAVPTIDTSGTLSITWSGSVIRSSFSLFSAYNLASLTPTVSTSSGFGASGTLTGASAGDYIAGAVMFNDAASPSITGATIDNTSLFNTSNYTHSFSGVAATSSPTVTLTGGSNSGILTMAAFK